MLARELAARAVASLPSELDGRLVLDVGCGPGHYAAAMEARGATVAAVDLAPAELGPSDQRPRRAIVADGARLPFASGVFDGAVCSNMLEHTPDPLPVLDEIERVLRPGGWAWVSWTNWLSPFGGHAIAPLHYLGPDRGLRVYRRLFGEPAGKNLPYDGVWPLHIATVLDHVRSRPALELVRVEPRYYPALRALMRVPGLREVVAWNSVLELRRTPDRTSSADRGGRHRPGPAGTAGQ